MPTRAREAAYWAKRNEAAPVRLRIQRLTAELKRSRAETEEALDRVAKLTETLERANAIMRNQGQCLTEVAAAVVAYAKRSQPKGRKVRRPR